MVELDNKEECQSALPVIQEAIPAAKFIGDLDTNITQIN